MNTYFLKYPIGRKRKRKSQRDEIHFSRDDDDKSEKKKKPLSRFWGFGAHEHSWYGRGAVTSIGRNQRRVVPGSDTRAGPLRGQGSTASFFLFVTLRVSVLDKENTTRQRLPPSGFVFAMLPQDDERSGTYPSPLLAFNYTVVAKEWVIALFFTLCITRRGIIFEI